MRRPGGALLPLLAFLAAAGAAAGEKKVMVLRSGDFPIYDHAVKGFKEALSARRASVAYDEKTLPAEGPERDAFLNALAAAPPDLVFTVGSVAARLLEEKGRIPFVYSMIVDPAAMGLTGAGAVMEVNPEATLSFIHEYFPAMKRVGVIHNPERNKDAVRVMKESKVPGLSLVLIQANTPEDVSNAILRLSKEADCLLMVSDSILYPPQTSAHIILQTIQNGLPIFAVSPAIVKAGALAALYPDFKDNGVQAAEIAARHFAGEPLDKISPQWAARTRIAVNIIVAQRLGVSVPSRLTSQAADVVK